MFGAIAGGIASALAGGAMSKLFGGGQKAASGGIQGDVLATDNNTVGMGDAGIKSAIQGSNVPNPDEAVPSFVSGAMAKAGKGLLEGTLQAGTSAVSDKLLDLVGLGGKSAADKGKDTRDYLAAAFPELNAWERAGADASSAGMVDAGFENQKELTKMQLDNQKEIAERSEERFSRNAETDIVCRLLLEKKNTLRKPQCMVVMGEAGIGKTRLAEETSRQAHERGWAVTWSRSYAQESTIPYRLWIEILRGLINNDPWQKQELFQHPLVYSRLTALLPELYDQLPGTTAAPSRQHPGQEQQSLWEAILELFELAIERTPMLVVLDDLQWADTSSCELLAYLVRRLSGFPIVFLGTCREIEMAPKHPLRPLIAHMQREHTITTLQLQPLTDVAISTLISSAQLPEPVQQDIRKQAAGNPFFAEELAHSYSATSTAPPANPPQAVRKKSSSLPRSLPAALDQRMSNLSRDCHQLLGNAAVLGGSFEFSLIRSMEISNSANDEDTILDLLDEALQSGVLTEEGRGARISYHFWQPLLVSHLYDGLSATKRAQLHRRAAAILRQSYANRESEGAATITHHLVEGGAEPQQIVRYATLAGDRAYALSAYPEAERYYRIATGNVQAALAASDHSNQDASFQENHANLAYLLEQLGECIRIQGNYEEARRVYEQLLQERGSRPH